MPAKNCDEYGKDDSSCRQRPATPFSMELINNYPCAQISEISRSQSYPGSPQRLPARFPQTI